jgi:hypothetical protein
MRLAVFATAAVMLFAGAAASQESGYQVIQGTRVFTRIDHAADNATFSNDCGRQTISHQDLAAGAIPTDIIPCPRPGAATARPTTRPTARTLGLGSARSYAHTCSDCQQAGGVLSCECRRIDQTSVHTSIRFGPCAGQEIENIDGRLQCASAGGGRTTQTPPQSAAGAAPLIAGCLVVYPTKVVSGSMGECDRKNGSKGHWNFTLVRSNVSRACPKNFEFEFIDPDEGLTSYSTPMNVQTCGEPPSDIRVKE